MNIRQSHSFSLLLLTILLMATACAGSDLAAPEGEVVLSLTGNITKSNALNEANLDMATLEGIGLTTLTVDDPWAEKEVTYEGVLMTDLLEFVGTPDTAREIFATASDGYAVSIPISEFEQHEVILATTADGQRISAEDKGPARLIFPYSEYPDDAEIARNYSIWSIVTMEVR